MTGMVVVGALAGVAVWLLFAALVRPRVSPVVQLAQLDALYAAAGRRALAAPAAGRAGMPDRVGGRLVRALDRRGIRYESLRADVALTGRSLQFTIGCKALYAVGGFLAVLLAAAGLSAAGVPVPGPAAAAGGLLIGAGLFFLPDGQVRAAAAQRRREFRYALWNYLEWVALQMAGSAAPAEALPEAARIGGGWPFALIRDTLFRARRAGRSQWVALSEVGTAIGVPELRDLGQLVNLAAADGAQVRATLTARAAGMRRAAIAEATGQAGKKDQSMQLAQIVLALGFLLFLGYPAVVGVFAIR